MDRKTIYFDYAASTPLDERVFAVMEPYLKEKFYNPSSPYLPAKAIRDDIETARATIAKHLGVKSGEIFFTAGATESIAIAIRGVLQSGDHLVTSAVEHSAVLQTAKLFSHTIVKPTKQGLITAEAVKNAITSKTKLVSIMLADSELGTVQPLRDIAQTIKQERHNRLEHNNQTPLYFHTDASQSVGLYDINVSRLGVDMLTLNAGKVYGPKQTGLLYSASNIQLAPFIHGGGQEGGIRSGTENVAGIIGFAKAIDIAVKKQKSEVKRLAMLRDTLQSQLEQAFPSIIVSGHVKRRLPNFLHIAWPGVDAERLVFLLEAEDILVATGSACAANSQTRSHILESVGMDAATADGSLRITLGRFSSQQDINRGAEAIIAAVKKEQR